MDYFKKIERSVTISADKRSTVDLQVDVWSQDLNVTKFILKLDTTDSAAIDLTNATVRVAMVYSQDGKDVKIEAAGIVEDVATQKIAYVMDDKLAGFEGLVIAGFYVTLNTGQRIDIQNVTFNMRKSLLDKDLEAAKESYYQTFDDIVADVQQTGDTAKTQIGQVLPDVQEEGEKVKTNINAVVSNVNGYADSQKQAINNIVADVQSTGDTAKEDIKATLPTLQTQVSELSKSIVDISADVNNIKNDIYSKTENLLSVENMSDGYLNNGILIPTAGTYKTTEYIDVSNITAVNLSNWIDGAFGTQAKTIRFGAYYTDTNESSFISQDNSNASTLTIPSNAKYARFTISIDYIKNKPMLVVGTEKPKKYLAHDKSLIINKNALFSKSAVFFGDSVCYGDFWRETENLVYPKNNTGWAYLLRDRNNMQVYGYGNSGATICKTSDTNSVLEQFLSFNANGERVSQDYQPDYMIFEGGLNDMSQDTPIGEITDKFVSPSGYYTVISALEFIFYRAKTLYPNTKVGYILPHHASGYAVQPKLKTYIEAIKTTCEKWAIPYCDLYTQCQINGCIEGEYRNLYFDQWGVHPNKAGYEIMTDVIEKWMLTL